VARRAWDVLIGEEVSEEQRAEAERHQAALKFFYSRLKVTNTVEKNESGCVKLLIRRMMMAPLQRFAAARIAARFNRTHDESVVRESSRGPGGGMGLESPHLPASKSQGLDGGEEAANEAALERLQASGAAAFRVGVRADLAPLAAAGRRAAAAGDGAGRERISRCGGESPFAVH